MFVDTKEIAFLQDLSKPSLRALSYLLRHKELWPNEFEWKFNDCRSCAMGLAGKLWGSVSQSDQLYRLVDPYWSSIEDSFPYDAIQNIFWGDRFDGQDIDFDSVTPEMVADEIDWYIHTKGE